MDFFILELEREWRGYLIKWSVDDMIVKKVYFTANKQRQISK